MKVFVRSPYNYDRDAASVESGLSCPEATLAQQQFLEECDINTIMRRFNVTGQLPAPREPRFGDFTGVGDFHSALNSVREASEAFMELPAELRKRFENDAGKFVDFVMDDANRDEAVKLGLVPPPPLVSDAIPAAGSAEGES